jgi:hypothetical protein
MFMPVSRLSATAPPTPGEFRAFADEAMDWARTAKSDKERAIFLQMARTWLEAAEALSNSSLGALEGGLPEHPQRPALVRAR